MIEHSLKVAILSSWLAGWDIIALYLAGPLSKLCQLKFITYPQVDLTGTVVNEITGRFYQREN